MRLVTITEYGTSTADYPKLVTNLCKQEVNQPHLLVATFGMADLIEVSLRQGDSHLHPAQSSGVHFFRRSFGALCPDEADLPSNKAAELTRVEEVLQPNAYLPLFATAYLKFSPIPTLCVPSSTESSLVKKILSQLSCKDSAVWMIYHEVLRASLGPDADVPPLSLKVSPLIGLDSVDVVLLSRAARLEQIAALAWALRSLKLCDFWKLSDSQDIRQRAEIITGDKGQSLEDSWNRSSLFASSATVTGLPLHLDESGAIGLEDSDANHLAAKAVCLSTRLTYTPGGFQSAVNFPTIEPQRASDAQECESEGTEFLLLFDRFDILLLPSDSLRKHPHELTIADLSSYLSPYIKKKFYPSLPEQSSRSVRARTEIAVLTRIPPHLATQNEVSDLYELFHDRLRKQRRHHLSREGEPSSWSQKWQYATTLAGLLYPVDSGVLTLIETVLEYLEDDLEGFTELLPAIKHLIILAERREDFPTEKFIREVLKLSGMLQGLATSRGRRDHPFRFPRETLAFEGHAGYRVPRAAFVAFVESLAASLDPQNLILVLESSGGAVSCRPGLTSNVVRVSPLLFSHPIHWVFAHEVAHGSFWHASRSLFRDNAELTALLLKADSIGKFFENFRIYLSNQGPLAQDFATAAGLVSEEVPADLMLWDTLHVDCKDPRETDRLFWFIQGPGLVFAHCHIWGSKKLGKAVIRPLILRIFFLCQLLAQDEEETVDGHSMIEDLYLVLKDLRQPDVVRLKNRNVDPQLPERGSPQYILLLLDCLRDDLHLSSTEWRMAVEGLWASVETLRDPFPEQMLEVAKILETLSSWLKATVTIRRELRPKRQPHADAVEIWNYYRLYLRSLIAEWPSSYPWLPVLPPASPQISKSHPRGKSPDIAIDPRGGLVFQSKETEAEYIRLTFDLLLHLDELGRESRFRKIVEYLQE